MLGAQQYQVDGAENGTGGPGQDAGQRVYDLVLLDVMMPDVSGIDLIKPIHDRDPETVCIIITGYATVELAVKAIKRGRLRFHQQALHGRGPVAGGQSGHGAPPPLAGGQALRPGGGEGRPLTEEKQRLEEIDRAKMAFVRMVTHELRAPVAAIQSYLRLILDGYVPSERQPEIIARAEIRAREELQLIADLLELSRLQDVPARRR